MRQIPLNTTDIEQALLNIEKKERSNPLAWNGQFSPQLVEILLSTYASHDSVVLDPFAGSGTLLYEAGRKNLHANATEINPAAYYLARMYTLFNRKASTRGRIVAALDEALHTYFPPELPLFAVTTRPRSREDTSQRLKKMWHELHNPDERRLFETLLILADFFDANSNPRRLLTTWTKLRSMIEAFPYSTQPIKVFNRDARMLPLSDHCIDLVITSPPYINVFNYHQQYRQSAEALGWDLLAVAKSEIGSNRKHRANRFLTVVQYCLDMSQVFGELERVCRKSARVIVIVGRESRVRFTPFYIGEIVGQVGTQCAGFRLVTRQERVFKNKFGESIYEDILHFAPVRKQNKDPLETAREISLQVLKQALKSTPRRALTDIEAALACVPDIQSSPIYNQSAARKKSKQTWRFET